METVRTDLLVMGGGVAGVSAALAAARNGASVLLAEKRTSLGGLATGGLVMPFMGVYGQGKPVVEGNFTRIRQALQDAFPQHIQGEAFQAEAMKHTLDMMTAEAGVDVWFDTVLTDVRREGRRLAGVCVQNKTGAVELRATCYLDATGDGDVISLAGLPYHLGREEDGRTQACTLRFILTNVDVDRASPYIGSHEHDPEMHALIEAYAKRENVPIWDTAFQHFHIPGQPHTLVFNVPRILQVKPTDGQSLSGAYRLGRHLVRVYCRILREQVPGCEQAVLAQTAELLGVRESRRLAGAYVLTADDVARGELFEDGIAGNAWYIDIHNPNGRGILGNTIYPKNGRNGIPYRSLYTEEAENLLVAGRCISATHEALAAIRIMPTCMATGEAAGVAAAMAIRQGCAVQEVDADALRAELTAQGALVPGINLL